MRVYRMLFVSLMTLALLAACSQNDTKEKTKEDVKKERTSESKTTETQETEDEDSVLTAIKEKNKSLKSYHANMDMTANLDESEDEELNAEVDYIADDPPSIQLTSFDVLRMVSVDGKTYFNNNDAWVDISDSVELNALFHATYDNAVQYFDEIFNDLEKVEEDDEVKYVYEGNDGFIYNRLEKYLQVNFGTVNTSNHKTKIEFFVSKEDVIEKVKFSSDIEDDEGGIDLEGDIHYSDFNQIKEITLPDM